MIDYTGLVVGAIVLGFLLKTFYTVIGYLIIRLGAQLLREGVKGEFKFEGSGGPGKASLASASPGLLFVLLGVVLAGYAMSLPQKFHLDLPSNPPAAAGSTAASAPAASGSAAARSGR